MLTEAALHEAQHRDQSAAEKDGDPNNPFTRFQNVYVDNDDGKSEVVLFQNLDGDDGDSMTRANAAAAAEKQRNHRMKSLTEDDVATAIRRTLTMENGQKAKASSGVAGSEIDQVRTVALRNASLFLVCASATVGVLVAKPLSGTNQLALMVVLLVLTFLSGAAAVVKVVQLAQLGALTSPGGRAGPSSAAARTGASSTRPVTSSGTAGTNPATRTRGPGARVEGAGTGIGASAVNGLGVSTSAGFLVAAGAGSRHHESRPKKEHRSKRTKHKSSKPAAAAAATQMDSNGIRTPGGKSVEMSTDLNFGSPA